MYADENELLSHVERGPLGGKIKIMQLMASIGIVITLMIVVSLLLTYLIDKAYSPLGKDILTNTDEFLAVYGDRLNPYRWIQMLSTILTFALPAIFISYLITGRATGYFDMNTRLLGKAAWMIPILVMTILPVVALLQYYLEQLNFPESMRAMEDNMLQLMDALLKNPAWGIFLLNFLMIAILPAVCEELLFRGVLQRLFGQTFRNPHLAILITGLIFGLIHGQVTKFLPIMVLGILLGYLYYWTKNLWFPILAHLFNNGVQVFIYFLFARGSIDLDLHEKNIATPVQTLILTIMFAGFLYLFYNVATKSVNGRGKLDKDIFHPGKS